METVTPRSRQTRLPRSKDGIDTKHVGDDTMLNTCPRCGWPCTHLVRAYWNSPWNPHGGICSQCIKEAVRIFDRDGWPPEPQPERPKPQSTPQHLWED